SARRLRRGKSELFALALPRVKSSYAMKLFGCILAEARRHGFSILVLESSPDGGASDIEQIGCIVKNHNLDGLIVAPPGADNVVLMKFLKLNKIPYVTINPNLLNEHPFSVESTDRIGAYDATRYLISLGHRRIAHIMCLKTERFSYERRQGYLDAMEEAGLTEYTHLIGQGDTSMESGHRQALELLTLPEPPTAIFAGNDEMAVGAFLAAGHLGLSIPGDLSVIGFDDAPISTQVFPQLTTVAQPISEIARVSIEKLLEVIEQENHKCEYIQLPTQLVLRDSCGALT
ncbi:MAG: substrate-binding domain-containing protein, partial [Anaerolineae bacterium]|nr:substrate-binding domain-containing protein [Anaerolineae bacterium]